MCCYSLWSTLKYYNEIKNSIVDKLIVSENSSNNNDIETKEIKEIILETKEIEI